MHHYLPMNPNVEASLLLAATGGLRVSGLSVMSRSLYLWHMPCLTDPHANKLSRAESITVGRINSVQVTEEVIIKK